MKKITVLFVLSFSLALAGFSVSRAAEFGSLPISEFYAYDHSAPLNAVLTKDSSSATYTVYRVDFDGVWGRRIPGLFMVPANLKKPCPAIIFGHGYTGNKGDARGAYDKVAAKGFCMMSIDMWYHGDRKVEGKKMYSTFLYSMREGLALSVIDLRRTVDFLESRPEVDRDRISYVGGSMGGILGGLFAGVDTRVKSPVLVVGGGNWPYLLKNSIVGQADLHLDYDQTQRMARQAATTLAPVDTLNTVQNIAPRPLLMINAKHDILVNPFTNKEMFLRAKPPKKIVWFDSDHGVPLNDVANVMLKWYDDYLINGHAPDFTSVVEGFKTSPLAISDKIVLPPIVTGISFNEYLRYDNDLPLLSENEKIESPNSRMSKYKIRFQSTHDRFVEGILNLPTKGEPPYPVVVFVHDLGGSANDVDLVADILARNGVASVSIGLYGFLTGQTNLSSTGTVVTDMPNKGNGGNNGIANRVYGQTSGDYYMDEGNAYTTRNLLVQSVQDIQRTIDMLAKYESITLQSLTVLGVGMGGDVAVMVGATDDRVKGVLAINPYNHLYINPEKTDVAAGDKVNKTPTEIHLETKKQLDVLNPNTYIAMISPRPVMIVQEAGGEDKNGAGVEASDLYKSAAEPKEYVPIEGPGSGVSNWIGACQRDVAGFVRDVIQGRGLGTSAGYSGVEVFKIETPEKGLDKWGKSNISGAEAKNCSVETLEWSEKPVEGGNIIILNSRIGKCAGEGATVISEITENGTKNKYIGLYDNGKGYDNKAGDGIFSTEFSEPKDVKELKVTVGGVGNNGEEIVEKTVVIKL